uniref:Protein kinase domain-containing protein n=1 Tax=Xiphophorus couchianus TaxID=32473 RepID=A0A3B5MCP0_9TELE
RDQTAVRLAYRREQRTDWVMNNWGNRNGRVGELVDLLESLQLFRPRDIILKPESLPAATDDVMPPSPSPCGAITTIICWTYEEVHAGTRGFSPNLQVGEGGFGVVYRATLSNMDCAVKRLRQVNMNTPVAVRFRHPNIVDLLGFSEGEGGLMCLIYSYMQNRSLEDQLQNVTPLKPERSSDFPLCVCSSNILLDQHLVPKLSDFGLARYVPQNSAGCSTQTSSVGKTTTVRGTLAYLPDEYVRRGELCTAVDVYSYGVVRLPGADGKCSLSRSVLPQMSQPGLKVSCLSRLGPSEQTCPSSQYDSSSSSSSSSFGALAPPHPLQSSCLGSVSPSSSPCPSLAGPCETDESRGFSQYDFQFRSNGTSCRTQSQNPAGSAESQLTQPSVPTEDLYNFPSSPSSGAGPAAAGFSPARSLQSTTAGLSGRRQRLTLVQVFLVNPSKQRLLEQKSRYEAGRIRTPELLSLDDLCT